MSRFETAEVPFVQIGNRRGLTRMQVVESPWLLDFMNASPGSFEPAIEIDAVLFIEPDTIPIRHPTTGGEE